MNSGLIFDVKRYAINDGPGIRITIFLKGCYLDCAWCHNPESISPKVQKLYSADKCIGCNTCVEACPENACELTPNGIVTDPALCKLCGVCADVCPTKATEMSGRIATVEEIVAMVEKERIFFDQSGGGVTFSGGEPLMHPEFLIQLLDACGEQGIHRTVDTTGFAKTEILLDVAKRTDHFLYDLKMMDSERHKKWTNVGNERILDNLKVLAATSASINIRIPLIKGVNDDDENIEATAKFVAGLAGEKKHVNLLPYHNIMLKKYEKLGEHFDAGIMAEPEKERQQRIITLFAEQGVEAMIGG
ncbi:MAG: glycyl-radical enzyme activating protein [Calditrichaeota bacterium]|nr:MAG: glycyl-radical enzyme activating protein [Calditrichota bacterium]